MSAALVTCPQVGTQVSASAICGVDEFGVALPHVLQTTENLIDWSAASGIFATIIGSILTIWLFCYCAGAVISAIR